jgi:hypothetical protein
VLRGVSQQSLRAFVLTFLGLTYRELLMGFLIGRCLSGKFDILLCALALDLVEALLAGGSHVEQPGFSQSQGRGVKMEWDRSGSESLEAMSAFIYTSSL